jgi:transposase
VHVASPHPAALCPSCLLPSFSTNGTGWRDVIDVVRTLVITLSVCVRRFVCENEACCQRTFDERFEGIDRRGASERALAFFADLARGRATAAVARDLGVPLHYLRVAVGEKRRRANHSGPRRLGRRLAIDECSVAKPFLFATVFSDPDRGIVIDVFPGREASAVWAFASQYRHHERAVVQVVTMDCHAGFRKVAKVMFPNAVIVADAFHLHRLVLNALADVRRTEWRHIRKTVLGGDPAGMPRRQTAGVGGELKRVRFALARPRRDLSADTSERGAAQRAALAAALTANPKLAIAYELKELFRAMMAIAASGDVALTQLGLDIFDALCRGSRLKPLRSVANTFKRWRAEIIAYAATGGASNAFAEAINHLIKNQKRQAHGYPTWPGFRGQILWTFGEAVDPDTGELRPLRTIPRGQGAHWQQPQFA